MTHFANLKRSGNRVRLTFAPDYYSPLPIRLDLCVGSGPRGEPIPASLASSVLLSQVPPQGLGVVFWRSYSTSPQSEQVSTFPSTNETHDQQTAVIASTQPSGQPPSEVTTPASVQLTPSSTETQATDRSAPPEQGNSDSTSTTTEASPPPSSSPTEEDNGAALPTTLQSNAHRLSPRPQQLETPHFDPWQLLRPSLLLHLRLDASKWRRPRSHQRLSIQQREQRFLQH